MYQIERTITGYQSSVNVLQFSNSSGSKRNYLLSGDDSGLLRVFCCSPWNEYRRYLSLSAVLCALWHPLMPKVILFGCAGGELYTIRFNAVQVRET